MPTVNTATTGVQSELQVTEIGTFETRDLTFSFPPKLFLTSCTPQRQPLDVSYGITHHGYGAFDTTVAQHVAFRILQQTSGSGNYSNSFWSYLTNIALGGAPAANVKASMLNAQTLRLESAGADKSDRFVPVLALGGDVIGKTGQFDLGPATRIDCGFRPTALVVINSQPFRPGNFAYDYLPYWNMQLFADTPRSGVRSAKVGTARSSADFSVWAETQAGGYAPSGNSSYDVNAAFDATGVDLSITFKGGFPANFFPALSVYVAIGGVSCDVVVENSPGAATQQTIRTALNSVGAALILAGRNPIGAIKGTTTDSQWGVSIGHVASNDQWCSYSSYKNMHGAQGHAVINTLDNQPSNTKVTFTKEAVASFSGSDVVLDWSADNSAGAVAVLAMGNAVPSSPWLYHLPV